MIPVSRRPGERERARVRDRIIAAYSDFIIRLYCTIRFRIINMRILDELEQYLPERGTVLDVGCGFGLFSLYFALLGPHRRMMSFDLNRDRIQMAQRTAARLGVTKHITFKHQNVLDYQFDTPADAIVTLDLLHHLPAEAAPRIIARCHEVLAPGGVLLVKDVSSVPILKRWFTYALDKAMDWRTPVSYYHHEKMTAMLRAAGFQVHMHQLLDILPYPHVLYICRKPAE